MLTNHLTSASALTAAVLMLTPVAAHALSDTVSVGSTVSATAWEAAHDGFSYENGNITPFPDGDYDEYVYRLFVGETKVDPQSTSGYDGLTEAEQDQWYIDAGLAPYDFSWHAFFCLDDSVTDPSTAVQQDAGVTLAGVPYVSAAELFPSEPRMYWTTYVDELYTPWYDGTLFDVDNFSAEQLSTVGYFGTSSAGDTIFATSYIDATCPTGSTLVAATINDPADPANPATDRDLTIPSTFTVDDDTLGQFEVSSDGVIIGVTGTVYQLDFNAALWGVAQVDGQLAATGVDADASALLALAGASMTAGLIAVRRRRSN